MGLYLFNAGSLLGYFWIRVVFSFVSFKDLFIPITSLTWMEVNFSKPEYKFDIIAWRFPIWLFFSIAQSKLSCIFGLGFSSSPSNSFSCCSHIHLFCYVFSVPIFCFIIIIIIIIYFSGLLSVSYYPSLGFYSASREGKSWLCEFYIFMSFCRFLGVVLISWVDEKFCKVEFLQFIWAGTSRDIVNSFIYHFSYHTHGSHYFWHSCSFKISHRSIYISWSLYFLILV